MNAVNEPCIYVYLKNGELLRIPGADNFIRHKAPNVYEIPILNDTSKILIEADSVICIYGNEATLEVINNAQNKRVDNM